MINLKLYRFDERTPEPNERIMLVKRTSYQSLRNAVIEEGPVKFHLFEIVELSEPDFYYTGHQMEFDPSDFDPGYMQIGYIHTIDDKTYRLELMFGEACDHVVQFQDLWCPASEFEETFEDY